jgi:hypothetical protein
VALIAEKRLSPVSRAALSKLTLGVPLSKLAVCADQIRNGGSVECGGVFHMASNPKSGPWHYIDIPLSATPQAGHLGDYCPAQACVTQIIRFWSTTLANPAAAFEDRQLALAFIVHFVGDLHQPMHVVDDNDRGGNDKPVYFVNAKSKLNLHKLWDDLVDTPAELDAIDEAATAERLGSEISPKQAGDWSKGDFIDEAALEGYAVAKIKIYPRYTQSDQIDLAYQNDMRPLAEQRLKMAGVRLAATLDRAFASATIPLVAAQ